MQKMLQRMQGNWQGAIQAMQVGGTSEPSSARVAAPEKAFQEVSAQKGALDSEWEALDERVRTARSDSEVQDAAKDFISKLRFIGPENIADVLKRFESKVGQCTRSFFDDLSLHLATRLKEMSSSQMALVLGSFLLWPAEARSRFGASSRDFLSAVSIEMPSRLMELAPHELNCCLAAYVALGGSEHRLFTAVGRSALARHKTFAPGQLAALLAILSEMQVVHTEFFNAAAAVLSTRARELRPAELLRALRALTRCGVRSEAFGQAVAEEAVARCQDRGANAGLRCEDLVEIGWCLCASELFHEEYFKLMLAQLGQSPKLAADGLCQLYEIHLALENEHKEKYSKFRLDADIVAELVDHYKENRREARRCSERMRGDVVSALKSLVEGTVVANHRTSTALLVDIAALRKKSSTDGFIHLDVDTPLCTIRPTDQDDNVPAVLCPDGAVAFKRRLLQKHGLRLVCVRDTEWRALGDAKEKRRHLRNLLGSLGDVLE